VVEEGEEVWELIEKTISFAYEFLMMCFSAFRRKKSPTFIVLRYLGII
jgi:hypothetical protein